MKTIVADRTLVAAIPIVSLMSLWATPSARAMTHYPVLSIQTKTRTRGLGRS